MRLVEGVHYVGVQDWNIKDFHGLKEASFEPIEPGLEIQFEAEEEEITKYIELGKRVAKAVKA